MVAVVPLALIMGTVASGPLIYMKYLTTPEYTYAKVKPQLYKNKEVKKYKQPIKSTDPYYGERPIKSTDPYYGGQPIKSLDSYYGGQPIKSLDSYYGEQPIKSLDPFYGGRKKDGKETRFLHTADDSNLIRRGYLKNDHPQIQKFTLEDAMPRNDDHHQPYQGPFSFNIGKFRLRQIPSSILRNRPPYVRDKTSKAGPLSFRIGPFYFKQRTNTGYSPIPCCVDLAAGCSHLFTCRGYPLERDRRNRRANTGGNKHIEFLPLEIPRRLGHMALDAISIWDE